MSTENNMERKLRRRLASMGYQLRKSRVRNTNIDDYGGYMIVDIFTNSIECGQRFDMTLEDVCSFVNG